MSGYPLPTNATVPADSEPTTERFGHGVMRWDVIAQLVRENGWQSGVEVGTGNGRNAARLLSLCPGLQLTTIDPWEPQEGHDGPEDWADWPHAKHEAMARKQIVAYADRCEIIKGYSQDAVLVFDDASLDFVFLDGDHAEASLRADIEAWTPKIKPGGMLLGHDAAWPGVRAAINDICPGYWIGPNDTWGISV